MKTAEEWVKEKEWSGNEDGDGNLLHYEWTADDIKQIQLDAMKEGMRRAATIAEGETFAVGGVHTEWEVAYDKGCCDCEKAILTAAEQLTEKDL